jgi:hypothetical protein
MSDKKEFPPRVFVCKNEMARYLANGRFNGEPPFAYTYSSYQDEDGNNCPDDQETEYLSKEEHDFVVSKLEAALDTISEFHVNHEPTVAAEIAQEAILLLRQHKGYK